MGIQVGLNRELSVTEKRGMKTWLQAQLAGDELAGTGPMPLPSIVLYIDGEARVITYGHWNSSEFRKPSLTGELYLRVGSFRAGNPQPTKPERLAVLGGIIGACGLWDQLTAAYSAAVGRVILEAYNSCFHDMIQAPQPAVVLAFSKDRQQVAVQYRDDPKWYAQNGEPVEVDESWQRVAA